MAELLHNTENKFFVRDLQTMQNLNAAWTVQGQDWAYCTQVHHETSNSKRKLREELQLWELQFSTALLFF